MKILRILDQLESFWYQNDCSKSKRQEISPAFHAKKEVVCIPRAPCSFETSHESRNPFSVQLKGMHMQPSKQQKKQKSQTLACT
jgi:hypothetical protein